MGLLEVVPKLKSMGPHVTMCNADTILLRLFDVGVIVCVTLGALTGIFSQILHGDEQIRERAITFLSTKIRVLLVEDALPKDAEDELVALCKKVK